MAALLPRSLAAGFALLSFSSSADPATRSWTILNNSDIGTHWNPALKTAPCQVRAPVFWSGFGTAVEVSLAPTLRTVWSHLTALFFARIAHQLRNASGALDCSSTLERCAEWCANTTACAAVSWNGPTSVMGKQGFIGCNFKCNSAQGSVWKGAVPGEGLAILTKNVDLCGPPGPTPSPPPPPPRPPPPAPPRPPLGPPPPRRVRWYTNICCNRLWSHDIAPGGALDPVAAKQRGRIATGVYTSGWPPAFGCAIPRVMHHRSGLRFTRCAGPGTNATRPTRTCLESKWVAWAAPQGTARRCLGTDKVATTARTHNTAGAMILRTFETIRQQFMDWAWTCTPESTNSTTIFSRVHQT
jgi:hypothetical protein